MKKFKVGDRVIGNKKATRRYGITREGWRGVVTAVRDDGVLTVRGLGCLGDTIDFGGLAPEYFDQVQDFMKVVITNDGVTTTAKLYNGNSTVKTAKAECSRDDAFDFLVGARIAFDRLVGEEKKPEPPKFPKEKLQTGVFGQMSNGEWFVVVGDSLIYQSGGYDLISELDENGSYPHYGIDLLVKACSFACAQDDGCPSDIRSVLWTRPAESSKK